MKHAAPKNVRTQKKNRVFRLPIPKLPTRSRKPQDEIFNYVFVNDEIIEIIVYNTKL